MSLTYIEYPSYKNDIKKVYLNSFPKEERFPFGILEECAKEKKSYLYAILDNETFVGMYFIVNCDNAYYLMYFSVIDTLRNKKYGSKILQDLKEKYVMVKGEAAEGESAKKYLIGFTKNSFGYEGLCLSDNLDKLAGFDIAVETPTLSQISIFIRNLPIIGL